MVANTMKHLLVMGCSETKRTPGLLPAIDRYDGSAYRVLRSYLREREWPTNLSIAVLSAKSLAVFILTIFFLTRLAS